MRINCYSGAVLLGLSLAGAPQAGSAQNPNAPKPVTIAVIPFAAPDAATAQIAVRAVHVVKESLARDARFQLLSRDEERRYPRTSSGAAVPTEWTVTGSVLVAKDSSRSIRWTMEIVATRFTVARDLIPLKRDVDVESAAALVARSFDSSLSRLKLGAGRTGPNY